VKRSSVTGLNVNPFTMQRVVKILNSNKFDFQKLLTDVGDLSEIIKYISSDKKPFLKAAYINQ